MENKKQEKKEKVEKSEEKVEEKEKTVTVGKYVHEGTTYLYYKETGVIIDNVEDQKEIGILNNREYNDKGKVIKADIEIYEKDEIETENEEEEEDYDDE